MTHSDPQNLSVLPVAELKGVSKAFGRGATYVQALRDVDLCIHAGELTLIEGPSGSGKTTLLHILGLLQRADRGEVSINGRRADSLPEAKLAARRRGGVSLIFQGYNLLDALTVRDNVDVASLLSTGASVPAAEHLARLGIERRAGHLPRQLSAGEKQRTAIARSLACRTPLVLADEPTANLDWENAQEVVRCLADLAHREGRAVVMVTHDSRLERFADRIIGLLDGRIRSDRRPSEPAPPRGGPAVSGELKGQAAGAVRGTASPVVDTPPVAEHRNARTAEPSMTPVLDQDRSAQHRARHRTSLLAWVLCLVLAAALIGAIWHWWPRVASSLELQAPSSGSQARSTGLAASGPEYVAAAPAVVEPASRLVTLRAERRGRIREILKRAGEPIVLGEPLVLLDDAVPKALLGQRQAELHVAEASLAKLMAWHREEQRAQGQAAVDHAQARLDRAERELKRIRSLSERDSASETELNQAIEEQRIAAAELEQARQALTISEAGPTAEDVGVAEAEVERARAAVQLAEAERDLYTIRAPLTGHVIYRHLEPGEVVDPEAPVPILSVGTLDEVRLRAEVDEADILRVHVGQPVEATADAFGERVFPGRVVHLEHMMGRKNIRTERTSELQDVKVREVLIELDPAAPKLPVDLLMTVRFLARELN